MRKLLALSALALSLVACTNQSTQPAPVQQVVTLPSFVVTVRPHDSTVTLKKGVTKARYCYTTSQYPVCNNMYPNGPERQEGVGRADNVTFSEEALQ